MHLNGFLADNSGCAANLIHDLDLEFVWRGGLGARKNVRAVSLELIPLLIEGLEVRFAISGTQTSAFLLFHLPVTGLTSHLRASQFHDISLLVVFASMLAATIRGFDAYIVVVFQKTIFANASRGADFSLGADLHLLPAFHVTDTLFALNPVLIIFTNSWRGWSNGGFHNWLQNTINTNKLLSVVLDVLVWFYKLVTMSAWALVDSHAFACVINCLSLGASATRHALLRADFSTSKISA